MTTEQIVEWLCRNYDNQNQKWQETFGEDYTMPGLIERFTAKEIIRRIEACEGEPTEEQEQAQYAGSSENAEDSNKDPLGVRPGENDSMRKVKIVSYGRYTRIEVNGETLEGVEAVRFEHDATERADRKDRRAKLHLDIDLEDFRFAEKGEIDRWEAGMDANISMADMENKRELERELALGEAAEITALAIEKAAVARKELQKQEKEKRVAFF